MDIFERIGLSGPWGTAVGIAAVALAVSPTLRKGTRKAVVSATASVMDMVDEIRNIGDRMATEAQGMLHEAQGAAPGDEHRLN